METDDKNIAHKDNDNFESWERQARRGRVLGGIVVVAVGAVLLARQLGADIPRWVFSWEVLLIVVGIYIGAKHSFRVHGWLIPVLIGSIFLIDDVAPGIAISHYAWPVIIIIIGLAIMIKPRRKFNGRFEERFKERYKKRWEEYASHRFNSFEGEVNKEDLLDATAVLGSIKKNIISKEFKGGETVSFFGGIELNLTQADINGTAVLEMTNVFGGTKLIVPPHWKIQSEDLVTVLGSIEDKRPVSRDGAHDPNRVLILKGTCVFGGIDIKSY